MHVPTSQLELMANLVSSASPSSTHMSRPYFEANPRHQKSDISKPYHFMCKIVCISKKRGVSENTHDTIIVYET